MSSRLQGGVGRKGWISFLGEQEGQGTALVSTCYLLIQPGIQRNGKKRQLILLRTQTEAQSQVN